MLSARLVVAISCLLSISMPQAYGQEGLEAAEEVHRYRMVEIVEYESGDGTERHRSQSSTLITVERPYRFDIEGTAYEETHHLNGGSRVACRTEEVGYEYGPYRIGEAADRTQTSDSPGSGLLLQFLPNILSAGGEDSPRERLRKPVFFDLGRGLPDRVEFSTSIKTRRPNQEKGLFNFDEREPGDEGAAGESDFWLVSSSLEGTSSPPIYPLGSPDAPPIYAKMATEHTYIRSSGILNQISAVYLIEGEPEGGSLYVEYLLYRTEEDGETPKKPYFLVKWGSSTIALRESALDVSMEQVAPLPLWAEQGREHFKVLLGARNTQVDETWRSLRVAPLPPQSAAANHALMIDGIVQSELVALQLAHRDQEPEAFSHAYGQNPPALIGLMAAEPPPAEKVSSLLAKAYQGILTDEVRFRGDSLPEEKPAFVASPEKPSPEAGDSDFPTNLSPCLPVLDRLTALAGPVLVVYGGTTAIILLSAGAAAAVGVAAVVLPPGPGPGGKEPDDTYSINGAFVTPGGLGISGVQLVATYEFPGEVSPGVPGPTPRSETVTTQENGAFDLSVPGLVTTVDALGIAGTRGWNATVTITPPAGFAFPLASLDRTNVIADENFGSVTATTVPTRTLTIFIGAPVSDVSVTLAGVDGGDPPANASIVTDSQGLAVFTVNYGWRGDFSFPIPVGYTLTGRPEPIARQDAIRTNRRVNFGLTGVSYLISGRALTTPYNVPIAGASISFTPSSPANPAIATSNTNSLGEWRAYLPLNWSGQYTVSAAGYTFENSTRAVSGINADTPNLNFSATDFPRYDVSGTVRQSGSGGLSNMTVRFAGTPPFNSGSVLTDTFGGYTLASLPIGWTGSVSVSDVGGALTISPPSRTLTDLVSSQSGLDFTVGDASGTGIAIVTTSLSGYGGTPDDAFQVNVRVNFNSETRYTPAAAAFRFTYPTDLVAYEEGSAVGGDLGSVQVGTPETAGVDTTLDVATTGNSSNSDRTPDIYTLTFRTLSSASGTFDIRLNDDPDSTAPLLDRDGDVNILHSFDDNATVGLDITPAATRASTRAVPLLDTLLTGTQPTPATVSPATTTDQLGDSEDPSRKLDFQVAWRSTEPVDVDLVVLAPGGRRIETASDPAYLEDQDGAAGAGRDRIALPEATTGLYQIELRVAGPVTQPLRIEELTISLDGEWQPILTGLTIEPQTIRPGTNILRAPAAYQLR